MTRHRTHARQGRFRYLIPLILGFLGACWLFLPEIKLIYQLVSGAYQYLRYGYFPYVITIKELLVLVYVILGNVAVYFIGLKLISRFLLPVTEPGDVKKAYHTLRLFQKGKLGPAIRIQDGAVLGASKKQDFKKSTLALVDLSSAVVYEKSKNPGGKKKTQTATSKNTTPDIGARGPGVSYFQPGERLLGVVDLRPQRRVLTDVIAQTRDKIELRTEIYIEFSVGQPAEELWLISDDGFANDIKVMNLNHAFIPGKAPTFLSNQVKEIQSHVISTDDQSEILNYYLNWYGKGTGIDQYPSSQEIVSASTGLNPYWCDPKRVIAAFNPPESPPMGTLTQKWTDLVSQIARETFRKDLEKVTYDDLYLPGVKGNFPLIEFRKNFQRNLRNSGSLTYRIVVRRDNRSINQGDLWFEEDYFISPLQTLRRSKKLRDRGIKVIVADFGELMPQPQVREQLFKFWQIGWEDKIEKIQAEKKTEIQQLRIKARGEARKELASELNLQFHGFDKKTDQQLASELHSFLNVAIIDQNNESLLAQDEKIVLWNFKEWLESV